MILVCNSCGEPYPGGGACDLHCGGHPARYSVGDPCGEVTGPDGDERVCTGTLVEAAVLPKAVADDQAAIVAAIERMIALDPMNMTPMIVGPSEANCGRWGISIGDEFGDEVFSGDSLRAALEAAVAAMEEQAP